MAEGQRSQSAGQPAKAPMLWESHLPVMAAVKAPSGGLETPKPLAYGTAFPVAPGVFLTAAHVIKDARVDGIPGLSVMKPGEQAFAHDIVEYELVDAIDLAILRCPSLSDLPRLEMDFDRPLDMFMPAQAVGFPFAVDAEYVRIVGRGFAGHVITRRELYHLPAQPPGYELSFFAPRGLSGAPVMSMGYRVPKVYGYIVQQSVIGSTDSQVPVAIAVDISVLLSIKHSSIACGPFAGLFGRDLVTPRPPSVKQLPGGMKPVNTDPSDGWPDDLSDKL
jgi:hypothetical protein